MLNGINACAQRSHHARLAVGMGCYLATHGVGGLYQGYLLFIGKLLLGASGGLAQHTTGSNIFDVVSTILHLSAHSFSTFRHSVTNASVWIGKNIITKSTAITMTSGRRNALSSCANAGSHYDTLIDSIPEREDGISGATDIANRGKSGPQSTHAKL